MAIIGQIGPDTQMRSIESRVQIPIVKKQKKTVCVVFVFLFLLGLWIFTLS